MKTWAVYRRELGAYFFSPVTYLIAALLNPLYYGPGFSLAVSLTPPLMRGRMIAVTFVLCNVLGAGIGPQIIGWISDYLTAQKDPQALPHAMTCLTVAALASGALFLAAIGAAPRGLAQPFPAKSEATPSAS